MKIFTDTQLDNWKRYEDVRVGGAYNMFDPNAMALTGLSKEDYMFCLENFSELKAQAEKGEE